MRENEKILNEKDDSKSIYTPVFWAVAAVCILVGLLVWFGIKKPELFGKMRDLMLVLILLVFFIFNTAVAVLFFFLSSRIGSARTALDKLLSSADGKVEELADKTVVVLQKILEPFVKTEERRAGLLSVFSRKDTQE